MKKISIITTLLLFCASISFAQDSEISENTKPNFFIGYDLGEMAFNRFQNFAGEVGVKFKNDHMLRFVYMNVKLTEGHLSSDFANAVDGENVTGLWKGYELLYDLPLYRFKKVKGFIYAGISVGYHENNYQHTMLPETVEHQSPTAGFDLGFRETDVLKIKGLYINFQVPVRFHFNKLEETKLGDSTVNATGFDQTISFFVGYQF